MTEQDQIKYEEMLCTNCSNNVECDHTRFVVNKFNNSKSIKCFDYIWKDKKD